MNTAYGKSQANLSKILFTPDPMADLSLLSQQ